MFFYEISVCDRTNTPAISAVAVVRVVVTITSFFVIPIKDVHIVIELAPHHGILLAMGSL